MTIDGNKIIEGLTRCGTYWDQAWQHPDDCPCNECPYKGTKPSCTIALSRDALKLIKERERILQDFLLDIPSSESIINSVNCHAISLEDASRIIAICACACDVMSSSGFIRWLKERFNQDLVLKGCVPK